METIGIIGAGAIGSAFARALARQNINVVIANSRGPDSLAGLVADLGPTVRAGTVQQAAAQPMVLVAVNWSRLPEALSGLSDFAGRIVIDANNAIKVPEFEAVDLQGRASTEVFSEWVPGARVVKAFNHLLARLLEADPTSEGGKRVLFLSGDDVQARDEVAQLIERLGFFAVDLGPLSVGARLTQFPGGPLPVLNLVKFD
ncbi:NADPH-dependent F420 reductase [Pseudomonas bijieensis]|uniref:NAD(P)-binding domain-containing protein n=1 Tax=Pseudomonas bijieensis TaxID=2681983 RepID=A0A6N1CN37_9PSED|nr:NAD(P)-binding domain-containing protein [Pseudomonas bijieensis]QKS85944.1 NAD(P)-binding domain-containing protein [Pseudomonas bijieensis]